MALCTVLCRLLCEDGLVKEFAGSPIGTVQYHKAGAVFCLLASSSMQGQTDTHLHHWLCFTHGYCCDLPDRYSAVMWSVTIFKTQKCLQYRLAGICNKLLCLTMLAVSWLCCACNAFCLEDVSHLPQGC